MKKNKLKFTSLKSGTTSMKKNKTFELNLLQDLQGQHKQQKKTLYGVY
jgi:hypothetical protein